VNSNFHKEPNTLTPRTRNNLRIALAIVGTMLLFLFALELMIGSLQHAGKAAVGMLMEAIFNPFTGLFIGLLISAMLQSSTATTSIVVALAASGTLPLEYAIPIIMGANLGTTITSVIVSLAFIRKKKEFKRAFSAGSYHVLFNLLTIVMLFPLEYHYQFLSSLSSYLAHTLFGRLLSTSSTSPYTVENSSSQLFDFFYSIWPSSIVWGILSVVILFGSIFIFRKLISTVLRTSSPDVFEKFFFKQPIKGFGWGVLITAAIRSSTVTTSLVVPLVAKRVVSLKQAAPFIMGANVGTTITAIITAFVNVESSAVMCIALAHFLFNVIGFLIFYPIPVLRKLLTRLSNGLGKLTYTYRLAGFGFLILTFFLIPFTLIYLNQQTYRVIHLTYEKREQHVKETYHVVSRYNKKINQGDLFYYTDNDHLEKAQTRKILPFSKVRKTLYLGNQMFLFNDVGYCWDGQIETVKYTGCVSAIDTTRLMAGTAFDAVYSFQLNFEDSSQHQYMISKPLGILLSHTVIQGLDTVLVENLNSFELK
jgi:sodium-dependent phosphate cotransporter